MLFLCAGRTYETKSMRQFLTDDPQTPVILMTRDNRRVFVMRPNGCNGSRIDQANTLEIISLSARYNLPELLNAFPAPQVETVQLDLMPA